ncbi:hypothetical protein NKR23_g3096 [Pleurostoma richardsiae]|uniref:Uncharacterized protein n=1 Tax=Pleurostoma richardsiae TaxID=41990 RepID=A0AA38RM16_9PEZI|nr:hypothetical protein NKR23_g3096 [Pleurostoma richardsiae]
MQAVPSLVGTGTVVAAAATGLAFGQPDDSRPPLPRPMSKRKLTIDYENAPIPQTLSRPGTSSASNAQLTDDYFSHGSRQPPPLHPLSSNPPNFTRQHWEHSASGIEVPDANSPQTGNESSKVSDTTTVPVSWDTPHLCCSEVLPGPADSS